MSYDLMLFDPAGVEGFPVEVDKIAPWINAYVTEAEAEQSGTIPPTAKLQDFTAQLKDKWGDMQTDGAPWMMWPPATIANGRYCTLNLNRSGDVMNWAISICTDAQKARLVVLDPQGNNPLMTAPGGGGIMDLRR